MVRQGGIWAVLGGAPSAWDDLAVAKRLLKGNVGVVACNDAAVLYKGHLHGFATLHPERLGKWREQRAGNDDFRSFVPGRHGNSMDAELIEQRWHGSSGLYAAQVAFEAFQASGVILCGVPMSPEQGHISYPTYWTGGTSYRRGFVAALPVIGARLRSMGGWTRDVFGGPTPEWIAVLAGAKPIRELRAPNPPRLPMYEVKNVSDSVQKVQVRDPRGGFLTVLLKPGEVGAYDVDPRQARFREGGPLTTTEIDRKPVKKPKPASAPQADAPEPEPADPIPSESQPEA